MLKFEDLKKKRKKKVKFKKNSENQSCFTYAHFRKVLKINDKNEFKKNENELKRLS